MVLHEGLSEFKFFHRSFCPQWRHVFSYQQLSCILFLITIVLFLFLFLFFYVFCSFFCPPLNDVTRKIPDANLSIMLFKNIYQRDIFFLPYMVVRLIAARKDLTAISVVVDTCLRGANEYLYITKTRESCLSASHPNRFLETESLVICSYQSH